MNIIQYKYSELLSIAVQQLFYENQVCRKYITSPVPDFNFMPTVETNLLIKRMGLILKSTERTGGFTILALTNGKIGPDELLRFPARVGDKLSFFMVLKTPELLNFSDLPVAADAQKIFYFSNEIADIAAPRNNLHITKSASGVDSTADYIKKSGEIYRYHHNLPVTPGTAVVKHLFTGIEISAGSTINDAGESDLIFNLSVLNNGKCELLINNIVTDEFYYTGPVFGDHIFAVLELSLSSLLDANYRIVEANKTIIPNRPLFTVLFNNRKTIWRYTINLQTNSPLYQEMAVLNAADKAAFLSNLKITSNDPAVTFTQSAADDTNIKFESDNPQEYKEKYTAAPGLKPLSLTLKKFTGLPNETVVKSDLQYPSTALLDVLSFPIVYADIFLTI
ncbi:MAG: hypothetical protein JWP81_1785 [Ferruginibacter sp.]|nr:hypothetical protein [Ferruginibacter sp.]